MHVLLWAEDSEFALRSEVSASFASLAPELAPGVLAVDFPISPGTRLPPLAFCRQLLPEIQEVRAESIRGWAHRIIEGICAVLPNDHPWILQVTPHYPQRPEHRIGARAWHTLRHQRSGPGVRTTTNLTERQSATRSYPGRHRCDLIRDAVIELLQKRRRSLLRCLQIEPGPFTRDHSLVQVLLIGPETGFVSIAPSPCPFEQRHLISFFPAGEIPVAVDKQAPSRAFAKLLEAELRMDLKIQPGQRCIDLGASPGSWTYVALNRGAHVTAIDRSPLTKELMSHPNLHFERGDAFRFQPESTVDWLLCDVIAPPEVSSDLLTKWLRQGWCRHFIVTIKMKDASGTGGLTKLKENLIAFSSSFFLTRLCANKKEVCAFGSAQA